MFDFMALFRALPGSVAQGIIWGIMALGVFITFKVLDYADMTVDGSLCTGGAVAVMCMLNGMPAPLALVLAFLAGMLAGLVTGIFNTLFGIPKILSGILTQLGLYSVNMRIMGKSNQAISVDKYDLVVSLRYIPMAILVSAIFATVVIAALYWFFGTELGCAIRATGTNAQMARAQGINTDSMKLLGLVVSNGLVALSGALYAQYQGNADINMGKGAIVIGLASIIIGEVIGEAIFGKYFQFALRLSMVVVGAILYYGIITLVLQLGLETTDLKLFSALVVALFLAVPHLRGRFFAKPNKKKDKLPAAALGEE